MLTIIDYFLTQKDISLVIAGSAGQGLKTLQLLISRILKKHGYFVFSTQELMSRIRGGTNSVEIRFSKEPRLTFIDRIDILIILNETALTHLKNRITHETIIISPFKNNFEDYFVYYAPLFSLLSSEKKPLNKRYVNSVIIALVCYLFSIRIDIVEPILKQHFLSKGEKVYEGNYTALKTGLELGKKLWPDAPIQFPVVNDIAALEQTALISGSEAIASGAIAAGCNFVCSYPMSPGTEVFLQLAKKSNQYHIGIEQTEDEISAVNMAIGAWYAGGRAFVSTAGGGFALMCEGVSLSGMTETPLVVMIGQRPGPATGLPTRTEQGDLNLVLYAGHGEFPRFIFAPGDIQQAFELTQYAFEMADKFQVPTFILSDQYFLDSYYTVQQIDETPKDITSTIIKTKKDYKRFKLTDNGISPRGIPGYGEGIVCADSDEHTEEGYITEDFDMRVSMQDKRMRKLSLMRDVSIKPRFEGRSKYDCLLVCWGSNYHVVKEAVKHLNETQHLIYYAMLHFGQLYPLHPDAKRYFTQSRMTIAIENNNTHQFATLIEQEFNVKFDKYILQYNGLPFSLETLIASIPKLVVEEE